MEYWQPLFSVLAAIAALASLAVVGVIKTMRKFNHPRTIEAKYLCIRCDRYYNDINEHLCYHRRD
ncbi:MAG TPA: hypothetical protein VD736_01430 [Nitrososphaera sp.]|nr:hypothetical protein [Nitrososphaera sp.]